jgi:hypothetical protein
VARLLGSILDVFLLDTQTVDGARAFGRGSGTGPAARLLPLPDDVSRKARQGRCMRSVQVHSLSMRILYPCVNIHKLPVSGTSLKLHYFKLLLLA